ncbi:hypothetical protein Ade02nite_69800 [Paractinoplanes deccanensis]|uniref:Peptidase S1 domain-containing protein n=1 Tax=Paractinoplanes deccanensis TaxID=113561 RepID=A0ABQ3YEA4_9ACTN|nr:carbohydrate binding domain-containing protein [Actinoplanes deccanensis]GID78339.1 hypothetical protein Ade02nite_69800 [Actinoplanes deccanensis]
MRVRSHAVFAAAAVAATGLAAAPAHGIAGGSAAASGAYPFVAHVAVGDVRACTGALVAASWVVTAAECFGTGSGSKPDQATTVTIGRSALGSGATGRVRTVTGLVRHPGGGVVLARLDAAVTDIAPVAIATTAPAAGETLRSAGYGRTATSWVPRQLTTADFAVDSVAAGAIGLVPAAGSSASTCKGDSGGPLFRAGTTPQLVALNATSWQAGCLAETETRLGGTGTRLDTVADWIARNTADPLPGVVSPPNTGFESGLTGWSQYGTGGNTVSTERAYAGTRSVKIVDNTTTSGNGVESSRMVAAPGIRYTATAWVNAVNGSPDLYLRFLDADGEQIAAPAATYAGTANQWSRLQLTAFAPAGTEQVSVLLYSSYADLGTAYADAVELTRTPAVPLTNPGFESGLTGWTQYGAGGNSASADRAYEGVNAAKVVDSTATNGTGLESGRQPAVAGVSYTVSARVNVTSGKPDLYVRFYNAAGDVLSSAASQAWGPAGVWAPVSVTLTAPAGTERVGALFYSNQANTGTAYYDQVEIRRTADVTVADHGFENGLGGWTQWGAGGNTASTDRAWTGTTSAKLVDTSTTTATGLESAKMPATAGVRYSAVARAYVVSGTPSIYLRFHDASGALITSTAADFTGTNATWQPLRVAATAPAGTAQVSVLLYSKAASSGTAYADHVAIQ